MTTTLAVFVKIVTRAGAALWGTPSHQSSQGGGPEVQPGATTWAGVAVPSTHNDSTYGFGCFAIRNRHDLNQALLGRYGFDINRGPDGLLWTEDDFTEEVFYPAQFGWRQGQWGFAGQRFVNLMYPSPNHPAPTTDPAPLLLAGTAEVYLPVESSLNARARVLNVAWSSVSSSGEPYAAATTAAHAQMVILLAALNAATSAAAIQVATVALNTYLPTYRAAVANYQAGVINGAASYLGPQVLAL